MKNIDQHARKAKRGGFLKYVWPKFGLIHGRVQDGSPVITFYTVNDVDVVISNKQRPSDEINPVAGGNDQVGTASNLVDTTGEKPVVPRRTHIDRKPKRKAMEDQLGIQIQDQQEDQSDDNANVRTSQRIAFKKSKIDLEPK